MFVGAMFSMEQVDVVLLLEIVFITFVIDFLLFAVEFIPFEN